MEENVEDHMGRCRAGRERRELFNSISYRRSFLNSGIILPASAVIFMFFLCDERNESHSPTIPKPQVTWGRRQLCRLPTPSPPISPPSPAAQGCVPLAVEPLQGQRPHRRIGQPVRCSPTCTNGKGIGDVSFSFLVLQVMPIASAPSSSAQLWPRGRCGCALVTVGHVWQALS